MKRSVSQRLTLTQNLRDVMAMMQADPEFEEVDTLSVMEDVISDALWYFTNERHTTRQKEGELEHAEG